MRALTFRCPTKLELLSKLQPAALIGVCLSLGSKRKLVEHSEPIETIQDTLLNEFKPFRDKLQPSITYLLRMPFFNPLVPTILAASAGTLMIVFLLRNDIRQAFNPGYQHNEPINPSVDVDVLFDEEAELKEEENSNNRNNSNEVNATIENKDLSDVVTSTDVSPNVTQNNVVNRIKRNGCMSDKQGPNINNNNATLENKNNQNVESQLNKVELEGKEDKESKEDKEDTVVESEDTEEDDDKKHLLTEDNKLLSIEALTKRKSELLKYVSELNWIDEQMDALSLSEKKSQLNAMFNINKNNNDKSSLNKEDNSLNDTEINEEDEEKWDDEVNGENIIQNTNENNLDDIHSEISWSEVESQVSGNLIEK